MQFNDKGTSFARTGSFRQATLTERLADPQSVIAAGRVNIKVLFIEDRILLKLKCDFSTPLMKPV